jgi:hypothetical protein
LLRISLVSLLIERMSQPIKRGACIKLSQQHGLINEQKYVQFVELYFSDIVMTGIQYARRRPISG